MGEERIKSDDELNAEQEPLSPEQLEEVAGGGFGEPSKKSNFEEDSKRT